MSKSVAEILDAAADLIEPEGAWTRGWYARDAEGNYTWLGGDAACSWCIFGALTRVSNTSSSEFSGIDEIEDRFTPILVPLMGALPPKWNDAPERTQAEVVSKLREAAAKAREHVQ